MSRNFTPHTLSLSIVLAAGLGTALLACSNVLGFKDLAPLADETTDAGPDDSDAAITRDAAAADATITPYLATAVGVGWNHACAVVQDRQVLCWGHNGTGQLGNGKVSSRPTAPVQVVGLAAGVTALALGEGHSCALEVGGAVQCWGGNASGQLGTNRSGASNGQAASPQTVVNLPGQVKAISAGKSHTCAVIAGSGDVYCWGSNAYGELGIGTDEPLRLAPVRLSALTRPAIDVAAGETHTCVMEESGDVYCWGSNLYGQQGVSNSPVWVAGFVGNTVSILSHRLASGSDHTCALGSDSNTHCWGSNRVGQLGLGTMSSIEPPTGLVPAKYFVGLAAGAGSSAALDETGTVWTWGAIASGATPFSSATVLPGNLIATSLYLNQSNACAVAKSGAVWCWGANNLGQIGDGTTNPSVVPVRVKGF